MTKIESIQNKSVNSANSKPAFILAGKTEKEIVEHCIVSSANRKYEIR